MIANCETAPPADDRVWRTARSIFDGDDLGENSSSEGADAEGVDKTFPATGRSGKTSAGAEGSHRSAWIGAVAIAAILISAAAAWQNRPAPDGLAETQRRIDTLTTNVAGLGRRVDALSADQSRWVPRSEIEASEAALRQGLSQISDRVDRVRDDAQVRDAATELRLNRIEANEATAPPPTRPTAPPPSPASVAATPGLDRAGLAEPIAVSKQTKALRTPAATPSKPRTPDYGSLRGHGARARAVARMGTLRPHSLADAFGESGKPAWATSPTQPRLR